MDSACVHPQTGVRKPSLQVFADGRVVNNPSSPKGETYEFQLTEKQLNTFLTQVVIENKFYELNNDEITKEMKLADQRVTEVHPSVKRIPRRRVADAPSTVISMGLTRGSNSVSLYASSTIKKSHPKIESIQRFAKIEKIAKLLVHVAVAGGYEKVERAMLKVNKRLQEKGLQSMTLQDLQSCRQKNDKLTIRFNKKFYEENGSWRDWINAKFIIIDGDDEAVEIESNMAEKKSPQA